MTTFVTILSLHFALFCFCWQIKMNAAQTMVAAVTTAPTQWGLIVAPALMDTHSMLTKRRAVVSVCVYV
jgi:hypothetical protein